MLRRLLRLFGVRNALTDRTCSCTIADSGQVPKKPRPSHAAGPLDGQSQGRAAASKEDVHEPLLHWTHYDPDTGAPMDDKQVASARSANKLLPIFYNSMQAIDYQVIDGLCRTSIIGPVMDSLSELIVGSGFKPELELIEPSGDSVKDQKELAKYAPALKELRAVQRHIDDNNDLHFVDFAAMLMNNCLTYGRSALIYGSHTMYANKIPTSLKFAHARDLSITVFDEETWRLESVLWQHGGSTPLPAGSMIYLWTPLPTARYRSAWQYGGSLVLPMLDAARALREIIAKDFPAMSRAAWARYFLLAVRPQGQTQESKADEYDEIVKGLTPGAPSMLMENPEDIDVHNIEMNPRVNDFRELAVFLIKYCCACVGLPASLIFDEGESSRASARSKLQYVMATVIAPLRDRLGRQICRQSYQKWLDALHPELHDKVRAKMVFEPLKVSEFFDRVEAALELDSRHELTDDAFGKMAEVDGYAAMLKPDAPTHAGGQRERPHNIQRDNSGKNLDVGLSKNREGME